jgi:hypothetical protein
MGRPAPGYAGHLVSLCDVDDRAWNTYQKSQPDTVLLIDSRGKVAQVARLTDLGTVAARARRFAAETGVGGRRSTDNSHPRFFAGEKRGAFLGNSSQSSNVQKGKQVQ